MEGLVGASAFSRYTQLPELATALLSQGFSEDEARKLLGGNYARVFRASLA
jgi:membrane dipeptidase